MIKYETPNFSHKERRPEKFNILGSFLDFDKNWAQKTELQRSLNRAEWTILYIKKLTDTQQ